MPKAKISVREFADGLGLVVHEPGRQFFEVETSDINRPGLQFSGYFKHFIYERVQLCGNAEMTYLSEMDDETMRSRFAKYFSFDPPCVVVARGYAVPSVMEEEAAKRSVPVLSGAGPTDRVSHQINTLLDKFLAPRITRHGVLMDIYGQGVMLIGESGVGKSETSLELVKRGHMLAADDVVEIRRVTDNRLVGTAPELVRHLMEIRGVGIINVQHMYGVGAVIKEKSIDFVIEMEEWVKNKEYDRLGMEEQYLTILDVDVPRILIPVRPGRNLAIVIEVAVRNHRLKKQGYNAAKEFDERLRKNQNKLEGGGFTDE